MQQVCIKFGVKHAVVALLMGLPGSWAIAQLSSDFGAPRAVQPVEIVLSEDFVASEARVSFTHANLSETVEAVVSFSEPLSVEALAPFFREGALVEGIRVRYLGPVLAQTGRRNCLALRGSGGLQRDWDELAALSCMDGSRAAGAPTALPIGTELALSQRVLENGGTRLVVGMPASSLTGASGVQAPKASTLDRAQINKPRRERFRVRRQGARAARKGRPPINRASPVVTKILTGAPKAQRDARTIKRVRNLFAQGEKALSQSKYDVALSRFSELVLMQEVLLPDERFRAVTGRGIARFHQQGCRDSLPDLRAAKSDIRFKFESTYYIALCEVEARRPEQAEPLFSELVQAQAPKFSEPSRFYLGVLADNEDRWEDAESAYLDTIDFAEDAKLQKLATERLAAMRARRASSIWEKKVVSLSFSLGGGYDSNAIQLPSNVDPASSGYSSKSSLTWLGLGVVDIKNPWVSSSWEHRLRYTGVALNYLNSEIASTYSLQTHDVSTVLSKTESPSLDWSAGLSYNMVYLGKLGDAEAYLNTMAVDYKWNVRPQAKTSSTDLSHEWNHALRYSWIAGVQEPQVEASNPDAHSLQASTKYRLLQGGRAYGPGAAAEFRPSKGELNSYWSVQALGFWEEPLGAAHLGVMLQQDLSANWTKYYQATSGRRDLSLSYSASLAKTWGDHWDSRLQLTASQVFSSVEANGYWKLGVQAIISAFY